MSNCMAIFRRGPPNWGVECRWGRQKSRFWAYLALMAAVNATTCQVLSTQSPVDDGHRLASYDTSLVISGGVDCGRRRQNVYDKKPRRYAKDNRTLHLTARSDKSVAYVTNNKRLYSTFCTVEANYRQIRSIARLFCDSRATCSSGCYVDHIIVISVLFRIRLYQISSKLGHPLRSDDVMYNFKMAVAQYYFEFRIW